MSNIISAPAVIRTKAGYTVDQLITKLQTLSAKGLGGLPVAIAQPPLSIDGPPQLALAGEGIIGDASDGRRMLVIMPNLNEELVNPFGGKNG